MRCPKALRSEPGLARPRSDTALSSLDRAGTIPLEQGELCICSRDNPDTTVNNLNI
jgi:hypothetical protein